MRRFFEGLCRLMLHIFFKRVDVVGAEQVPKDGPLLIVGNHPNGLMDPLSLLVLSPRPVSFLAKEPLFRTPVVSLFVKALDCLPVYRKQDGADTGANRRTMEAARELLGRGSAIGIFPEGISHDRPELQPLKTGAARMALAAQRLLHDAGRGQALRIQPVGLYFEDKATFRSEAVVVWGPPIAVPLVDVDADAEPSRPDALALTEQIAEGLRGLLPEAPSSGRVALSARVARLLVGLEVSDGEHVALPGMGDRLSLMRRLLSGYERAEAHAPGHLRGILQRIDAHERDLRYWGLPPDHAARLSPAGDIRSLGGTLLAMTLLAPLTLLGLLINYPAYRLIGYVAKRVYAREPDIISTGKTLGGLVLFPFSWALAALLVGVLSGPALALATLVLSPLSAWALLHFVDHLDALQSARRSLSITLAGRDRRAALLQEAQAIRADLLELEAGLPEAS